MNTLYQMDFSTIVARKGGALVSWRHRGHLTEAAALSLCHKRGADLVSWHHKRSGGGGYVYDLASFKP
jgi:hypothetical protein